MTLYRWNHPRHLRRGIAHDQAHAVRAFEPGRGGSASTRPRRRPADDFYDELRLAAWDDESPASAPCPAVAGAGVALSPQPALEEMQIHVRHDFAHERRALQDHSEERVKATFCRLVTRVQKVLIEFTEVDAGDERLARRCFVRVETTDGRTAAIDATTRCAFAALDRALATMKGMVHPSALAASFPEGARS